jgi:hypothetical protein
MSNRGLVHPLYYLGLIGICLALNLCLIPELAVFAVFGLNWANGAIYGQAARVIGNYFIDRYHLTVYSAWVCLGDIGSITGGSLVQAARFGIAGMKRGMY